MPGAMEKPVVEAAEIEPQSQPDGSSHIAADIQPDIAPNIAPDVAADVGAVLQIDLTAICDNYQTMQELSGKAECSAVVKADAYGMGDREVVRALVKQGCNSFFTANLKEAIRARRTSKKPDIYVLDGYHHQSSESYIKHRLRPVLNNLAEVRDWNALAKRKNRRLPAAIQLDTGMNRLGLPEYEIKALSENPVDLKYFDCALIMSHLACADDQTHPMNSLQRTLFEQFSARLPETKLSLANSAGIACGKDYHYDLTRSGIALYGGEPTIEQTLGLKPVVTLWAHILQIHDAQPGESVGYGARHTFTRPSRIATVSLGYADGFMRILGSSLAKSAPMALYGNHKLPLIGRVSMDLITYDLTDMGDAPCRTGDWVEIIGRDNSVNTLATAARTNAYEILTSLGSRPHRIYKRK